MKMGKKEMKKEFDKKKKDIFFLLSKFWYDWVKDNGNSPEEIFNKEDDFVELEKLIKRTIEQKDKEIKKLKKKIDMLEQLEGIANVGEWDLDTIYNDILEGKENGNKVPYLKPNPEFAKWFAKRYNIKQIL